MDRSLLEPEELIQAGYTTVYKAYEDYMLLINCAEATIKTYLSNFRLYKQWCDKERVNNIYLQMQVKSYLVYRVKNGAKWQTMNNIYSAMRKLFREVLMLDWSFRKLPRSKKEVHLPELISQLDVIKLIEGASKNLKHQTMIITLYSTGLRAGELQKLKLTDIDSDRLQIKINKGKGAKDRYVQIPAILINVLRYYYKICRPTIYLFNGKKKGNYISVSAIRWAIKQSKKKMKIHKKVSTHTLRHCYATHHLESGTDLVFLQLNMGHKHLKTTARYIHLCKERYQHIKHPIVNMELSLFQKIME